MTESREKAKRDFRQEATDLIVDMLEKGTSPWQRPWDKNIAAQQLQMPHNGATGRAYTGGNAMYLMAKGMQKGYDDPRWMTYEQASSKGWQVRQGEKATHVEFWQFEGVEKTKGADGKVQEQRVKLDRPIQRLYAVFNAKQIDGVPELAAQQREEWQAIDAAERALKNSGAKITHKGTEAYYEPSTDRITMPPKKAFPDKAAYYGTALHELAHWTGHESRLNREGITAGHGFGTPGYAREELRAEMASVFMQAELGVPHDINRHASYVDSWISTLKNDKNELFRAAKDAGAAADLVMELAQERGLQESVADQAKGVGGVVVIDDKPATSIQYERSIKDGKTSFDLSFSAAGTTVARLKALDDLDLDDAVGEKNAKTIRDAAADKGTLRGAALANEYGLSPEENARRSAAKEERKQAAFNRQEPNDPNASGKELDSTIPGHVALARNNARDKRVVELPDIEAVAYVDKQTGDLAIAAKSPAALKNLTDRARAPDAAVLGSTTPTGSIWTFDNSGGYAAELAKSSLQRLGVSDSQVLRTTNLLATPEQRREQLSDSFKDLAAKAKQEYGPNTKTYPAQLAEGVYRGPIVAENTHYVLQRVSETNTVAHMKTVFPAAPRVNKDQHVRIPYVDGKAQALPFTPERAREQSRSLGR